MMDYQPPQNLVDASFVFKLKRQLNHYVHYYEDLLSQPYARIQVQLNSAVTDENRLAILYRALKQFELTNRQMVPEAVMLCMLIDIYEMKKKL